MNGTIPPKLTAPENFPFEEYQENASTLNELIPLKHVKPSAYTFQWTETTRNRSNK